MNKKAALCFISLGLLLAGYAADPTVLDKGNGRLSVTGSSERGTPFAREDAVDLANAHCAQLGEKPIIESFDDKDAGHMAFRCD